MTDTDDLRAGPGLRFRWGTDSEPIADEVVEGLYIGPWRFGKFRRRPDARGVGPDFCSSFLITPDGLRCIANGTEAEAKAALEAAVTELLTKHSAVFATKETIASWEDWLARPRKAGIPTGGGDG